MLSQHALRQTPPLSPVDRQAPVKTEPLQTSFAGGNKKGLVFEKQSP